MNKKLLFSGIILFVFAIALFIVGSIALPNVNSWLCIIMNTFGIMFGITGVILIIGGIIDE